jgi:hypothetical protein
MAVSAGYFLYDTLEVRHGLWQLLPALWTVELSWGGTDVSATSSAAVSPLVAAGRPVVAAAAVAKHPVCKLQLPGPAGSTCL